MLQPEEVKRDERGFYHHSALNRLGEDRPVTDLPEAEDMEFYYVSFEAAADESLLKLHLDSIDIESGLDDWEAVRAWEPTRPEGDGWFLLSIYDTEDGPYACFTRSKNEQYQR